MAMTYSRAKVVNFVTWLNFYKRFLADNLKNELGAEMSSERLRGNVEAIDTVLDKIDKEFGVAG